MRATPSPAIKGANNYPVTGTLGLGSSRTNGPLSNSPGQVNYSLEDKVQRGGAQTWVQLT